MANSFQKSFYRVTPSPPVIFHGMLMMMKLYTKIWCSMKACENGRVSTEIWNVYFEITLCGTALQFQECLWFQVTVQLIEGLYFWLLILSIRLPLFDFLMLLVRYRWTRMLGNNKTTSNSERLGIDTKFPCWFHSLFIFFFGKSLFCCITDFTNTFSSFFFFFLLWNVGIPNGSGISISNFVSTFATLFFLLAPLVVYLSPWRARTYNI